jgi:hypothetical protein
MRRLLCRYVAVMTTLPLAVTMMALPNVWPPLFFLWCAFVIVGWG